MHACAYICACTHVHVHPYAQARGKAGLPPIMHGWGGYDEQRAHLPTLIERAHDDFTFLKSKLVETITDRSKLEAWRERVNKSIHEKQVHRHVWMGMGICTRAYTSRETVTSSHKKHAHLHVCMCMDICIRAYTSRVKSSHKQVQQRTNGGSPSPSPSPPH